MDILTARNSTTDSAVGPQVHRGSFLLKQAYDYAAEFKRDVWDFAVEISRLREAGLTNSDLRWLVCKKYVEHGLEITIIGSGGGRQFQSGGELTFYDRTCFVLTDHGVRFAENVLQEVPAATRNRESRADGSPAADDTHRDLRFDRPEEAVCLRGPKWDPHRHELRLGQVLVKVFKLPSRNQETILMAFEEEGWPPRIDDPLPPHPDLDPKRRLHDAIKGLNRNQKSRAMRFMGDGTGEGIRWEPMALPGENGKRSAH